MSFPPINPISRLRPPPFESPNAALEGYRQRIVTERQFAGIKEHRPSPADAKVAKFMGAYHQSARYGNMASAAGDNLRSAPELPASIKALPTPHVDAPLPPIRNNYGRNKNHFFTKDSVRSCLFDYNEEVDRETGRQRIKQLKQQIRSERKARRELETAAQGQGVPLDSALPHDWFETRDVKGRTVWRHLDSMEVSRIRPTGPPTHAHKVFVPGRDQPKPSYMEEEMRAPRRRY